MTAPASSCPVCATSLGEGETRRCERCDALHHEDCWAYVGRCAIFGCAPATPTRGRVPIPHLAIWTVAFRAQMTAVLLAGVAFMLAPLFLLAMIAVGQLFGKESMELVELLQRAAFTLPMAAMGVLIVFAVPGNLVRRVAEQALLLPPPKGAKPPARLREGPGSAAYETGLVRASTALLWLLPRIYGVVFVAGALLSLEAALREGNFEILKGGLLLLVLLLGGGGVFGGLYLMASANSLGERADLARSVRNRLKASGG